MRFCNLHRHDTFSLYDGFGTAKQAAAYAKQLGQTALGLTNHGNVSGLVEHYAACKDAGIKPVLGVEAYFQPRFDPDDSVKRYHLTLWCRNDAGYRNLMGLMSHANREQFWRVPIVDFALLEQYAEGLIAASGCILGYIPRLIVDGNALALRQALDQFRGIFGDSFYLELQPFEADVQKKVNLALLRLAGDKIMTLDSHYTQPEEFETYKVMHELANRSVKPEQYQARYLRHGADVLSQWRNMHPRHIEEGKEAIRNTQRIADSCDVNLDFKEMVPHIDFGAPSEKILRRVVAKFLSEYVDADPQRFQQREEYWTQARKELGVILDKGFEDYFLLCYTLVKWAKDHGIATSFGRGSVCGSLVAFCLGLTRVDPLIMGTFFERFLRPDKNVMPDVDLDFDAERRGEVVAHALQMFQGKSAPISNFQYWRAKNLWNALAKLFEVDRSDASHTKMYLEVLAAGDQAGEFAQITYEDIERVPFLVEIDKKYDGILRHFVLLYGQLTAFGKHAAGIAITADSIEKYLAVQRIRGEMQTSYDMDSLARLNVIKIDILGLQTASIIRVLEETTGHSFDYSIITNPKIRRRILRAFKEGNTEGIFQFEKGGAKNILSQVAPETFEELAACNALNRPGPVIQDFVDAKNGKHEPQPWDEYLNDTSGVIVYQEQVMQLCRAAGMEWSEADKVMKSVNAKSMNTELRDKFVAGAVKTWRVSSAKASRLYRQMTLYLFNKGHACGYTLIGYYQMYFKLYYPVEFWWATLRYEEDDYKQRVYQSAAARAGVVIFPPHVNGTARCSLESFDGDRVIRMGLSSIKGIGPKAASVIESLKPYRDDVDFFERVPPRSAGKGIAAALESNHALDFDQKLFLDRVVQYNARLAIQELQIV